MASSLANLPKLRRTLTDVMEDELYHIPGQNRSNGSSPTLQHALLANTQRFNGSMEMLSIPDAEADDEFNSNPALIDDDGDDDMLMDDDEEEDSFDKLYTPQAFNVQPPNAFHEHANPNVFNSYNNHLHQPTLLYQDPFQSNMENPTTVSPRDAHIKLPEELLSAESANPLFNTYGGDGTDLSQLFVWPDLNDKNQFVGPEQLYFDEISADEDEDDFQDADMNYFDVNDSPPFTSGAESSTQVNLSAVHDFIDVREEEEEEEEQEEEVKPVELKSRQAHHLKPTPSAGAAVAHATHHSTTVAASAGSDGVHQCQMINPSTHKPCLKQFSRPYDLVRHQETIHASKKKIYRCTLCEDDFNRSGNARLSNKTFSRGDALSRHIRVKHGLTGSEANEAIRIAKENVEYIDVAA